MSKQQRISWCEKSQYQILNIANKKYLEKNLVPPNQLHMKNDKKLGKEIGEEMVSSSHATVNIFPESICLLEQE